MRRYVSIAALAAACVIAFSGCSAVEQTGSNPPAPRGTTTPPLGAGPAISHLGTIGPAPTGENKKFFDAVVKDDAATVASMLKTSRKFLKIRDAMNSTPLLVAASDNRLKCAAVLIQGGANVNAANDKGRTPLHAASSAGHLEMVKTLIAKGAKVDVRNKSLGTPLHAAAVGGSVEVARYLLSKGANIEATTRRGVTPLIAALAKGGHKKIAQFLTDNGAKFDQRKMDAARTIKFGKAGAPPGEKLCCEDL